MTDDYIADPFKNYTMKGNNTPKPIPAEPLVIDATDAKAVKRMAWDKLVAIAATAPANAALLPVLREIFDRIDGKPIQAVNMQGNLNVVTVNANIEFIQSARDKLIVDHVDKLKPIDNEQ